MRFVLIGSFSAASVLFGLSVGTAHATVAACNPLTYGAVGNGVTDNTTAIQTAINNCAAAGGGIVPLSVVSGQSGIYLTSPIQLKSHIILQINASSLFGVGQTGLRLAATGG